MNAEGRRYVFKVIVIGYQNSGKTTLVNHYTTGSFNPHLHSTTGIEYSSKDVTLDNGLTVKLQIWDTAGQERFRSLTKTYYRGSVGAVVLFDLTSSESFEKSIEWYKLALEICGKSLSVVFVGNKRDLADKREVDFKKVEAFVKTEDLSYVETSCLNGENVDLVFSELVENILVRLDKGELDEELVVRQGGIGDLYKTGNKQDRCSC